MKSKVKRILVASAVVLSLFMAGCDSEEHAREISEAYNSGYENGYEKGREDGREAAWEDFYHEQYHALDKVRSKIGDKEDLLENYYSGYVTVEEIADLLEEIDDGLYNIMEN